MPENKKVDPSEDWFRHLIWSVVFCFLFFIGISVVFAMITALARADVKTPKDIVKSGVNQAKSIIDNPSLKYEEKRKQLHNTLMPFFAADEVSRRVLGVNFKKYEKRLLEFTPLFIELIENQYLRLSTIDSAKGAQISYGEEKIDGDYATVDTVISTKNGTKTPVSYRLILRNGEWKVFDIIIEGVSLVSNYRSQFNAVLNRGASGSRDPFDFLLDKIREKIAQAKKS